MEGPIQIDGISVEPGHKLAAWLDVAEDFSGPLRLPFLVVNGARPGKCLYVVSGLNGDNYVGMDAIVRLFRQLDPQAMSGQLLAVPMLNAPAFDRMTKAGPDGVMINRAAGGKKHGSLTERIAHWVLEKIVAKADYALEIITGTANAMTPFVSLVKMDQSADYDSGYLDYAKSFGCDLLWTGSASPTVMRNAIARMGVQVIMTELAGDGYYEEEHVQYEMRAMLNLLGFLGIIERVPAQPPSEFLSFDNFWMHADHGGFFRREAKLRQRVRKGDLLGRISDLLGNETEVVTAAHDGIVIGYRTIPRIYPGDWSVWVGNI